ncbi:MAG: hypothetical protein Q9176_006136 [Flavoplaca citrina]
MPAAGGTKRGRPPKKPNAAARLPDQQIKQGADLKEEEHAGSVNDAFINASNQEATHVDDTDMIDSKAGVATCIDVTDQSVSISSQTDDTLASASPRGDLDPSSLPALEKAIKDLSLAATYRKAKLEQTVQVHNDRITAIQRRQMVYNSKSSQLSKLKQAKQLLASVLSQVSPLQGILRELEHGLQPQVQQAFLDAMLAFEAFYNLNDAIAATTRDFGNNQKHLEAEAKHLETELQEAEEDAMKARKNLEANVNWLAGVRFI